METSRPNPRNGYVIRIHDVRALVKKRLGINMGSSRKIAVRSLICVNLRNGRNTEAIQGRQPSHSGAILVRCCFTALGINELSASLAGGEGYWLRKPWRPSKSRTLIMIDAHKEHADGPLARRVCPA